MVCEAKAQLVLLVGLQNLTDLVTLSFFSLGAKVQVVTVMLEELKEKNHCPSAEI